MEFFTNEIFTNGHFFQNWEKMSNWILFQLYFLPKKLFPKKFWNWEIFPNFFFKWRKFFQTVGQFKNLIPILFFKLLFQTLNGNFRFHQEFFPKEELSGGTSVQRKYVNRNFFPKKKFPKEPLSKEKISNGIFFQRKNVQRNFFPKKKCPKELFSKEKMSKGTFFQRKNV